jgi:hypothetical protein
VTALQWENGTHPALVASAAHPNATRTLSHAEEHNLLNQFLLSRGETPAQ